ncbi:MAG: hypothetical protein L6R41_001275 [Letrouitia leprolyta]|nr:MAG: hypothetical protein L6R41_001275 [Letrouitia leprolyta]
MDPILTGLNNGQLAAVTSPTDVLQILAPPGSGKTKTLTSRVAYLINHHKYQPWNILCLTFTIKSAREMKQRLARLIGNGMEAKLILGTFHSICRRYLATYGHLIGIAKDFGIVDSSDTLSILKRIIKRMGYNVDPKAAQFRISGSKSKGISFTEFSVEVAKQKKVDQQEFAQVFEAYQDQLELANLLDYDDLLLRCCDLLRQHPTCVSNVEAVLIDEFQDTNVVQFDLMRLFAAHRKRITTVGDPDQSIYGWRSAEIKNLGRMQSQYPETLVIHLKDNYRSSAAILLTAQEVIEQDVSRPAKSLSPTHCPGTSPVLRRLPSSDAEASWIVSEIKRAMGMTGGMLKHPDFAILLRSAALSRQIESAMGKAGVPYRMVGGQRFFDRVEIKILLDYLRVISQPTNNDAITRILNIPARSVGTTTVKALLEEAETQTLTLWSFIRKAVQGNIKTSTRINKPAEQGLGAFINIILSAQRKLKDQLMPLSPQSLLQHIISKLNFQDYLKRSYEIDYEGRWANVEELLAQAAEYPIPQFSEDADTAEAGEISLPAVEGIAQYKGDTGQEMLSMFLANVALATELQKDEETEEGQSSSQVTISTIHAAKGLEWPVVFIPAAYEGSIPHSRAEDTDEERRLLYVAMTRAQALLYISCPVKNSQREQATLSQFLNPTSVSHYLAKAGAKFDSDVVSDIARILGRHCPPENEVQEKSLLLPSREDNMWPLDGQENPELMASKWDNKNDQGNPDNRRQVTERSGTRFNADQRSSFQLVTSNMSSKSTVVIGNSITMENCSSFSMQSLGGFTSAMNQLQQQAKEQHMAEKSRQSSTSHPRAGSEHGSIADSRKRKIDDRAQSSLTSLWGVRPQSTKATRPIEASHAKRTASYDVRGSQLGNAPSAKTDAWNGSKITPLPAEPLFANTEVDLALPRIPLATVPQNFSNHKIPALKPCEPHFHTTENAGFNDRYAFLSSSPPINSLKQDASKCEDRTATGHVTSTPQVEASSRSRKTLGVRRSMGGWNARGVQGFSVPSKVQRK